MNIIDDFCTAFDIEALAVVDVLENELMCDRSYAAELLEGLKSRAVELLQAEQIAIGNRLSIRIKNDLDAVYAKQCIKLEREKEGAIAESKAKLEAKLEAEYAALKVQLLEETKLLRKNKRGTHRKEQPATLQTLEIVALGISVAGACRLTGAKQATIYQALKRRKQKEQKSSQPK